MKKIQIQKPISKFTFDDVFGIGSQTQDIYNRQVHPIVQEVLEKEINGTVLAYGHTGSGKTHTMIGGNPN